MDPIPARIRIRVIPIPALLDVIPAPDPDPLKSGIVTPLWWTHGVDAAILALLQEAPAGTQHFLTKLRQSFEWSLRDQQFCTREHVFGDKKRR